METTQEAIDKLAALVSPEIWLQENGYRGRPANATSCVLAVYLEDKTGIPHRVDRHGTVNQRSGQYYSLPDNLSKLTQKFDEGRCPALARPYDGL